MDVLTDESEAILQVNEGEIKVMLSGFCFE